VVKGASCGGLPVRRTGCRWRVLRGPPARPAGMKRRILRGPAGASCGWPPARPAEAGMQRRDLWDAAARLAWEEEGATGEMRNRRGKVSVR
jgi:hypothetical protein